MSSVTHEGAHHHDHHETGIGEAPYVDPGPGGAAVESLVLDIGGDVGALIIHSVEECLGQEIDLTPVGAPRSHHTHTMIRRRRAVAHEMIVGVYPELSAGTYTVWGLDGSDLGEVVIVGGQVAEFQAGACRSTLA